MKTRLKGKKKKNKTPKRNPRTISGSPAPYLTGSNPGGSASAEPRLLQQLVTALRGISSVTPNPSDSQGGVRGRNEFISDSQRGVRERSEFTSQREPTSNMNPQQWGDCQWPSSLWLTQGDQSQPQGGPYQSQNQAGSQYYPPPHHFM